MGHEWTIPELYATFERIETLEYLADSFQGIFDEPVWVPCIMRVITPVRIDNVMVKLALLPSSYAQLAEVLHISEIEIIGLDQIKNRLRPRKYDETHPSSAER